MQVAIGESAMQAVDYHPSRESLEAFTLGRLDVDRHAAVEEHVNGCSACQRTIDGVPDDALVALLRSAVSFSDTPMDVDKANTISDTPAVDGSGNSGFTAVECSDPADLPPALVGHPRYQPTRQLGSGGMGTVWLAQHRLMGRPVAVKVIRPEFVAKPGAAERFHREAQAAARLHHANIVTAFDAENAGGSHLLAMEFVEGVTLADLVRERGPMAVAEACDAIRQAALGLQHAVDCGLIHRDLKPHNLMRTADGTVKILDFGLAVLADANRGPGGLTAENVVLGTPDYIAPEQAEDSRAADVRSDIYSLGCTLYHLLTGRVPFPGDSVLRKLDGHRRSEPEALRKLRPEVPAELAAVVAKMMAKKPANRFRTPAEVAAALAPFAAGRIPARHGRRLWAAGAAVLLAGIVTAAGVVYRIQTDNGEVVITPQSPDVEIVLLKGGKEFEVIDTKRNKRVRVPTGVYDVQIKNKPAGIEVKTDKIVVSRGKEALVTIERVAKSALPEETDRGLVRVYRTIGLPVLVVAASPDGGLIAAGGGAWRTELGWSVGPDRDVRLLDRASGKELHRLKGPTRDVLSLAFSPDGKRLAAASNDQKAYLWDVESGKLVHTLSGHTTTVNTVAFLPDGKRVLTLSWDRTIRLWDAASGKELRRLGTADGLATEWAGACILPGGKEAVVAGWSRLLVLDLETDKVVRAFAWPGGRPVHIYLSADGTRLLTGGADGTDYRMRLWDVATGKVLRQFDDPNWSFPGGFLPDGRHFLAAGGKKLGLVNVDSGKVLESFQGHEDDVMSLGPVPGHSLAVSGSLDQTVRLWRLPEPPAPGDRP
jgi:WD40 repeat protein